MKDQQIDRALTLALRRQEGAAADVDVRDCVDAERLAAWSSGALSGEEAAEVERHLSACERCQDVAAVFAESAPAVMPGAVPGTAPASVTRAFRTWVVPLAAAAAVVLWFAWPRPAPPAAPAATVARALPSEPRPDAAPPSAAPGPPPTAAQPTAQGGASAVKPGPVAGDLPDERRESASRSDSTRRADEQKRAESKAELAQRAQTGAPAAPAPTPIPSPPPPPPVAAPVIAPPPPAVGQVTAQPTFRATVPPAAPPPPPPAAQAAAAPPARDESRTATMTEPVLKAIDPRAVVAEFASLQPAPEAVGGTVAGAGRGGGGGGRGGAAGVMNREIVVDAVTLSALPRWRVLASGAVERSTDGGTTWTSVLIDPPAPITTGASPFPAACWVAGRGGVVMLSTNGQRFLRVTPPTTADIASIRATSAREAAVTTTDGRTFRTTDGGVTWIPV